MILIIKMIKEKYAIILLIKKTLNYNNIQHKYKVLH